MSIGTRIYEQRKRLNLSQEYVADFLDTTKQAVYKYENGIVKNIPTEKIEKLAQLFGVTPQYLAGWEEKPADESGLPKDEQSLLELYRRISDKSKDSLIQMLTLVDKIPDDKQSELLERLQFALQTHL